MMYQNFFIGFILTIYAVYVFLDAIDDRLNTILEQSTQMHENELMYSLKCIRIIVDKICDVLEDIKLGYSINTIGFMMYFVTFCIFCIYGTISYFLPPGTNQAELVFLALIFMWTLYNSFFFVAIILISCWIIKKVQIVEAKFHKLLLKYKASSKICMSINTSSMQLFHRSPIYSTGLYVIDWKFLFSVFASSFTYVIIIIQFEIM
jgi:hypothetical protein